MKKVLAVVLLIAIAAVLFGCTQSGPAVDLAKLTNPPAATIGSDNAPVTVIEYSDYQCPLCRKWFLESKKQLIDEYVTTGKVKFEFKDYPLLQNHPLSGMYAAALRCAGEDGKYWEMHDKVYSEQDKLAGGQIITVSNVTAGDVSNWAKEIGIDSNKFNTCLVLGKFDAAIAANENEGTAIGINGTPSFVVGKTNGSGELIVGAQPYSILKAAIENALK